MAYAVEPQEQQRLFGRTSSCSRVGYRHRGLEGSLRIRVDALDMDYVDHVSSDVAIGDIVYLGDRRVPIIPCHVDVTASGALMGFRYAVELNGDEDDEHGDNDEELMQRREKILGARNGTPRVVADGHGRECDMNKPSHFRSASLQ